MLTYLLSSLSSAFLAILNPVFGWSSPYPKSKDTPTLSEKHKGITDGDSGLQTFRHPVVEEFKIMIEEDPELYMGFHQMFEQIPDDPKYLVDPTGKPQISDYKQMLEVLDTLLTRAPEFGDGEKGELIPVPFNAMLNWPMCTPAGFRVFTYDKVNAQIRKILTAWAAFLSSPDSRYVLTSAPTGWFSPDASLAMPAFAATFECSPLKPYHGFSSWDDFFTRKFRPGVRPIADPADQSVITNACESVAYKVSYGVEARSPFWLKGETYSLYHMLNNDPLTSHFVGGTVYQAYLSALNYHRWHSPVDGTVVKIVHVPGTYCASSPLRSFESGSPDPGAPGFSQAFTTNLATRLLIFIRADNPDIGLMCFIAVGMVEVSSCEATVRAGGRVKKGGELGMFHFGGSTHCLVFRPETKIMLSDEAQQSLRDGKTMVLLNSCVARVSNRHS